MERSMEIPQTVAKTELLYDPGIPPTPRKQNY